MATNSEAMKATAALLGLALVVVPDCGRGASAVGVCDCFDFSSPSEARDAAAAVVRIRVARIEEGGPPPSDSSARPASNSGQNAPRRLYEWRRVHVRVLRVWKGNLGERATISTSDAGIGCGYPFARGQEYLAYAVRGPNGRLITSICSRTRPIAEARDDLAALGTGARPGRPPVESDKRPHN